jgi:hypothetical protein
MSWAVCYSGSNNIHFNFPPIMADGRNYASWQPDAVVNKRIQQQENIQSNWAYRQYLQQNGLQIMKYNSTEACYDLGLDPHTETNTTPSSNVPYTFRNIYDTNTPGYGYSNSDLKNPYLSREQLNARMIAPVINPSHYQNANPTRTPNP